MPASAIRRKLPARRVQLRESASSIALLEEHHALDLGHGPSHRFGDGKLKGSFEALTRSRGVPDKMAGSKLREYQVRLSDLGKEGHGGLVAGFRPSQVSAGRVVVPGARLEDPCRLRSVVARRGERRVGLRRPSQSLKSRRPAEVQVRRRELRRETATSFKRAHPAQHLVPPDRGRPHAAFAGTAGSRGRGPEPPSIVPSGQPDFPERELFVASLANI